VLDVFGDHKNLRRWQSDGAEPERGEGLPARCHDGPPIPRQPRQEFLGAGDDFEPIDILQLRGIEPSDLRVHSEIWEYDAKAIPHLTSMMNGKDGLGIEAMPLSPATPRALDDRLRIDQHAIEVEEQRLAAEF
jgi:hypothetical protein